MSVDVRKAAKALQKVMKGANSSSDTPLSSLESDAEIAERVASILVQMQYATVSNGSIRLTESGEAVKHG